MLPIIYQFRKIDLPFWNTISLSSLIPINGTPFFELAEKSQVFQTGPKEEFLSLSKAKDRKDYDYKTIFTDYTPAALCYSSNAKKLQTWPNPEKQPCLPVNLAHHSEQFLLFQHAQMKNFISMIKSINPFSIQAQTLALRLSGYLKQFISTMCFI